MSNKVSQDSWRPKRYPAQSGAEQASPDGSTLSPEEPTVYPRAIRALEDNRSPYAGGRPIIICLDGTGDKFDNDNSNVVNFVSCLKKDHPDQITYYQSGIGTYDKGGLTKGISAALDSAVGSGLGTHVRDAYHFLMQNYNEGDRICLFGFSRGSYTVRCLAGMLHKVGLLPADNVAQINFAYQFYKNDTREGFKLSGEFKRAFCTNVEVYFVGVWDCVASVGFFPRKLPFSKSPTRSIRYFRHAMALDEHRAKFKVCQWRRVDPKSLTQSTIDDTSKAKAKAGIGSEFKKMESEVLSPFELELKKRDANRDQTKLELQFDQLSLHEIIETDVLEVWFAGCHADVGGGAVLNTERHMLSRVPLRWMIRQCFECNTGILFNTTHLAEAGIDVPTLWPVYKTPKKPFVGPSHSMVEQYEAKALPPLSRRSNSIGLESGKGRSGEINGKINIKDEVVRNEPSCSAGLTSDWLPEQVEDHFDAISPINDQLVDAKAWWILEAWPVKVYEKVKHPIKWQKVVRMNMGRFRAIRDVEPKMHWTVEMRMRDKGYKIRNRIDDDALWHVTA